MAFNPIVSRHPGSVLGSLRKKLPIGARLNNFGDLLGPVIVREIARRENLDLSRPRRTARLLSVGSVLRLARDGDVLWGTGANGKSLGGPFHFADLDVRSVRGPNTREFLLKRGVEVPQVYGDPGLLVGKLWPRSSVVRAPIYPLTVIPNFNDYASFPPGPHVMSPLAPLWDVVRRIAASEFVTGSSLHAIVLADSFGIDARLLRSTAEPEFKYEDYYLGSGRTGFTAAGSVAQAVEMGPEQPVSWDAGPLLSAFPRDLWNPLEAAT